MAHGSLFWQFFVATQGKKTENRKDATGGNDVAPDVPSVVLDDEGERPPGKQRPKS